MNTARNHLRGPLAAFVLLTAVMSLFAHGCESQEAKHEREFSERIPLEIPFSIIFEGTTYKLVDERYKTVQVIPDGLQYSGEARREAEPDLEAFGNTQGSPTSRVYAIEGVDTSEAVCLRFESANGVYLYYLKYEATEETGADAAAEAVSDVADDLIQTMSKPYPEDDGRYLSSNPYDYTKDNPAFDQIVALGYDALDPLEAYLPDHAGLDGYLVCIAIEKIMRCDLKQFGEFTWADAISFRTQWSEYLAEMPSLVDEVLARELSPAARAAQIATLGAPAVPYLVEHAESLDEQDGTEIATTLGALLENAEPASTVEEFGEVNAQAIAQLKVYVEAR
ncbi:MAG: hypothetical protein JW990_06390 [Thermoleophilia bacterium]|nr:hypothetical protein [Thermoleophilia bacterium]